MSKYWSNIVQQLDPYVPGEQPQDKQYIKLNTNENPYPPSPAVLDIIKHTSNDILKRYPDPEVSELRSALAKLHNVSANNVFVGNGSDEVLAHAFHAFFNNKALLYPDICYSFYPVYSQLYQSKTTTIPLDDNFCINPDDYCGHNKGIIFPNPNAPTSRYLALDAIEKMVKNNAEVVIVDEAYIDFGGDSAIELTKKYDNLLVIQTFSKSRSMAGLRIGYAIGHTALIDGLNRIKNSFNSYPVDCIAQVAAVASINDQAYFEETTQKVIKTREFASTEFTKMGFEVIPSSANFIMAKHPDLSAENLYNELKNKGILVRYFKKPRIDDYLRITIGTNDEIAQLIATVASLMSSLKT
ncbi:MAG: histidinol-phosphate transaminase [Gammaproteobacteria bacterium]|nr:histidinol-phosphate transaminase [Gammaproteobacteria bacterium]